MNKKKDHSKQAVHGESKEEDEIKEITPNTMKRKSQDYLLTVVGDFMLDQSINSANQAVACLVQYVNTVKKKAFKSIEEMKEHMAEKAKTRNTTTDLAWSSSSGYNESSDRESD